MCNVIRKQLKFLTCIIIFRYSFIDCSEVYTYFSAKGEILKSKVCSKYIHIFQKKKNQGAKLISFTSCRCALILGKNKEKPLDLSAYSFSRQKRTTLMWASFNSDLFVIFFQDSPILYNFVFHSPSFQWSYRVLLHCTIAGNLGSG